MSGRKEQVAAKRQQKEQGKLEAKASASANTAAKVNSQGWRSSGNACLFKLKVNETMVAYHIRKSDGLRLGNSQNCNKYGFEFHPMRTTGNPVYIRMDGNEDNSLITKFATKNTTSATLRNPTRPGPNSTKLYCPSAMITDFCNP